MEALTVLSLPFGLNSTFNNISTSVFQTLFLYVFFEYFTGEQQEDVGRSGRECNVCIHIHFDCGLKKNSVSEKCLSKLMCLYIVALVVL